MKKLTWLWLHTALCLYHCTTHHGFLSFEEVLDVGRARLVQEVKKVGAERVAVLLQEAMGLRQRNRVGRGGGRGREGDKEGRIVKKEVVKW